MESVLLYMSLTVLTGAFRVGIAIIVQNEATLYSFKNVSFDNTFAELKQSYFVHSFIIKALEMKIFQNPCPI